MVLPEIFLVSEGLVKSPRKVGPPVVPLGSWFRVPDSCSPSTVAFLCIQHTCLLLCLSDSARNWSYFSGGIHVSDGKLEELRIWFVFILCRSWVKVRGCSMLKRLSSSVIGS